MEEVRGLYIISVAARLLEMHPQTLRKYERAGFLTPSRTVGMLRLYSEEDILRLQLIKHLVEDLGLNLAGVELCLKLAEALMQAHQQLGVAPGSEGRQQAAQQSIQGALELLGIVPRREAAARRGVPIEIQERDG
ncbi:MAG: MerR family transcriptional regulator [Chloroflexi bacterium]|nr:MerR family transcriptional regulator [Chloroflexota bacterium]